MNEDKMQEGFDRLERRIDVLCEHLREIYALVKHIQMRVDNQTTKYYPGSEWED